MAPAATDSVAPAPLVKPTSSRLALAETALSAKLPLLTMSAWLAAPRLSMLLVAVIV
jgi:hypothetical protein